MKDFPEQRKKTLMAVLLGVVALGLLLFLGSRSRGVETLTRADASTAEGRMEFLMECGWETDPGSEAVQEIHIPERFTTVYDNYNDLQRQQGYDLLEYAGKDCTLYSYTVLNYPDKEQTVIADLYVYKNRIIGGDVHSTNLNGFMIGLK